MSDRTLPEEDEAFELPDIVLSPLTSGFFGNWEGLSDEDKIRMNEAARKDMAENEEWNKRQRARNAFGLANPIIYRSTA
ncbi:MAG: hypothetical protein V1807_01480 [Patescibacteria group bacterium]